ncbi:hypothetical protein MANES_11G053601v8 [Manihot esculenta]|uniref:Uncharacterized protein n=1 Tax=Manihot esculenta TaxID=3983 RepID=A0ACB7GUG9_MANES|nr:hypothetical protein MANES_11G053601v8 [Manihot esculenta]
MAGLQRSAVSFRRQGSSGIVWDDKFLSGELNQVANQNQEHQQQRELQEKLDINQERDVKPSSSGSITTIERSRSNGGQRAYRTGKVSPAIEPPSPRVSACGFCSAFGKPTKNHRKRAAFGVGFYCRRRFVSKNLGDSGLLLRITKQKWTVLIKVVAITLPKSLSQRPTITLPNRWPAWLLLVRQAN